MIFKNKKGKSLLVAGILALVTLSVTVAFLSASPDVKVTICHVPPGNPENTHEITISENALAKHMENHPGDGVGACSGCGDGLCNPAAGEDSFSCPIDCGAPTCAQVGGACVPTDACLGGAFIEGVSCGVEWEGCCVVCGDGICSAFYGEDVTCPVDCEIPISCANFCEKPADTDGNGVADTCVACSLGDPECPRCF